MHKGNLTSSACIFLLLLITPVSPQCWTGTSAECRVVLPLITGHELASKGIDITTLDVTEASVFDLSTWKYPNDSCTLCENPLPIWKPREKLPLAISKWQAKVSCQEKVQSSVHQTAISAAKTMTELLIKNDWKKELDVEVKSGDNVQWTLAGSRSKMTSFVKRRSSEDKHDFLLQHISCSFYKFQMTKGQSASDNFKNDVKALPEKYDHSSKLKYRQLIRKYGTHYKTEFDLGARFRYLTALAPCKMALEGITISEIRRCLELHLVLFIGFLDELKNPDYQRCEEMFHTLSQFLTELNTEWLCQGGTDYTENWVRPFVHSSLYTGFSDPWLEKVSWMPALLSYSLEPLHTMLDRNNIRRESVRQAVSAYVRERTLWRNCTLPCPQGVQHSAWDSCSCECPNNSITNSMCCSHRLGLATLTITIESASGLWGDIFSRADAYVRVLLNKREMHTCTVWNNNNPEWNISLDFGIIQTLEIDEPSVEVWDQDYGWNDDLLGKCTMNCDPWETATHVCYLNHGRLYYKCLLACGPQLGGPNCLEYHPPWKMEKKLFSQHKGMSDTEKRSSP